MDKQGNLIRSNSVPLLNVLKPSLLAEPKRSETHSIRHEISKKSSLNQLSNDDCITIQSQLSIENQNSELKPFNNTSRQDIKLLLSPKKANLEDPVRVIKITEIIEINNKNNPEQLTKKQLSGDKNFDIFTKLNINKDRIKSIQNTNYKVSPNGSFYELNDMQPLIMPRVENVIELKRRNELLENEIRLMKEKFNETQILLENIKSQNMINSRAEPDFKDSFVTIPVVHNFSFITPDNPDFTLGSSSYGQNSSKKKKISVKIFGRTRSQSDNNRVKEKEIQHINWNIDEEEPNFTEQVPNLVANPEISLNQEEQKFDLDKFKFYLKKMNLSSANDSTFDCGNYSVVDPYFSSTATTATNQSEVNRSSSMPPAQMINNFNPNKDFYDSFRPAVVPKLRSRPQRILNNSKWTNPFENLDSFCLNQHASLLKSSDEIIERNSSAFSSVQLNNNSCVGLEQNNGQNVSRVQKDGTSEMQIQGDEIPIWTFREIKDTPNINTKSYDIKKEPIKNQITSNFNSEIKSTFSCGLLNKLYGKNNSNDKNLNSLYKEEDENYEKNNSPSLSVSSNDTPGVASAFFNFTKPQKISSSDIDNYIFDKQNSNDSSHKVLNLIENYLNRHTNYSSNNTNSNNVNKTENKEYSYESYLLKKINEKEKTSSLPVRQRSAKKSVSTYYNDFYKDQLCAKNSISNNTEHVTLPPLSLSGCSSGNTELYAESKESIGADFNARYIDEEDYSEEYHEIKRNGNETKESSAVEIPEQQMSLSTFTLSKTPKLSRRVIFADEVIS